MTTTKLTKAQQEIVDFVEAHEGVELEITEDVQSYVTRVLVQAIMPGTAWFDSTALLAVTASYYADSARPTQSVYRSTFSVMGDSDRKRLKLREVQTQLQILWSVYTEAGRNDSREMRAQMA